MYGYNRSLDGIWRKFLEKGEQARTVNQYANQ